MRYFRSENKRKIEHDSKRMEREKIRKRTVTEYFLHFSRFHRPWMRKLADMYKLYGELPMIPMVVLPSYYKDIEDKEVAIFAALLIKEDGNFDRIQAFHELLGDSPWKWFVNREFVKLSLGDMQDKRTGGVLNWKIAKLMDALWNECHYLTAEIPNLDYKQTYLNPIGVQIEYIAQSQRCSFFDVLTYVIEDCCVGNFFYKLRLLLMILGTSSGFGLGLWKDKLREKLHCPLAPGIRQFVETWFPDYKKVGSLDNAIKLLGFETECDFFYAWLGYKELQKRNPKGCALYATRYASWYERDSKKKKFKWILIQPEIPF